ncbi:MAG TPA: metallophosphoesterase family protein [Gemmatimonadaceae bacterium]|nr:metallophosphoesterase family protein [Gemmatimonadaceae bacterium]
MRIAALYDIHGNLPALEAVLDDVRHAGVDHIVVGGDVLPGPMPRETMACLRALELPTTFICGNADRETIALMDGHGSSAIPASFREAMRWGASELTPDDVAFIRSWPPTTVLPVESLGDVLFCHATPRNDTEVFTRHTSSDALAPVFRDVRQRIVVCGHTHMAFDRTVGETRVVNAGSVGMPFGEPGAYWLLLGPDIEPRRTEYDLALAAQRVRATGYPQASEFAERNILQPPTEQAMLEVFARAQIRADG